MIIGFLGKGGSGKSTLSSRFVRFLDAKGKKVLAVDADHNMDLSFNLGAPETMSYIGQGLPDVLTFVGQEKYRDVFVADTTPQFSLSPRDSVTEKYSVPLSANVRLMSAGPHTDQILYDQSCSHVLGTPLKVYLPLLNLGEGEYAVVDEKAGADGAGTGVTTGFTMAVVIAEPTPHGIKAAQQIADLLHFYGTPFIWALNKVDNKIEDRARFRAATGEDAHLVFGYKKERDVAVGTDESEIASFEKIMKHLEEAPDNRLMRTKEKYKRNKEFANE
jgi:CO dehydrogenase maturation factor